MNKAKSIFVAATISIAMAFTHSYAQKKCGAEIYNPKYNFCYNGEVYDNCNGMQYNPSTHICTGRTATRATCNGVNYNPLKQRCGSGGVQVKCGNYWYVPSTQFCSNNSVYDKCGGKEYAPKTHHCSGSVIKKSGTGTFTDDRDGKSYKTVGIGGRIWMAENLNYEAEGSVCYNNSDSNCYTYGRLYNWETAMKSCPSGWHLPSKDEWQALVNFAGGDKVAGKELKAKSGWKENGNGTDGFGFSGRFFSDGSFGNVGSSGSWWSSSEVNSDDAYSRYMTYDYEVAHWNDDSKAHLSSVRCVQD